MDTETGQVAHAFEAAQQIGVPSSAHGRRLDRLGGDGRGRAVNLRLVWGVLGVGGVFGGDAAAGEERQARCHEGEGDR